MTHKKKFTLFAMIDIRAFAEMVVLTIEDRNRIPGLV